MRWFSGNSIKSRDLPIEDLVAQNVRLADEFSDERFGALINTTAELIDGKSWEATEGVELNGEVIVTIAANAAIPVMNLGAWVYRQVRSIIVNPTHTVTKGIRATAAEGVYHDEPMSVIGTASPYSGPISLSWDSVIANSLNPERGQNVVIHEFAHKIDMSDGFDDGVPPVRGEAARRWAAIISDEFDRTASRESDVALDSYAWTNPAEFFAVATETYFCRADQLRQSKPELYSALDDFYQAR